METQLQTPQVQVASPKKILSIISLIKKLGISFPIFDHKCNICKHEVTCIDNVISNSFNSFKYGYVIRCIIGLIGALIGVLKTRKDYVNILKALIAKPNFNFGLFLGSYAFINKSLLCLMRNIFNSDHGFQDFFSGAISGLISMNFIPFSNRFLINLYLFSRALEAIYRHNINKNQLDFKSYDYVIIFCFVCSFIGYCYSFEPDVLPGATLKIYHFFSNMDKNDSIFRDIWIEIGKKNLKN